MTGPILHHQFFSKQLVLSFSLLPNMYGKSKPVLCITTPILFQTTGFHFVNGSLLHHLFYIKQPVFSLSPPPLPPPPNIYGKSVPVLYYTTGSISNNWFSICERSPITPPVLSFSLPHNIYGTSEPVLYYTNRSISNNQCSLRDILAENTLSFNCSSIPVE